MSDTFFRNDGWIQTPMGEAVAGASVAVLDQPADFSTQPGSPLADIYAAPNSNSASITAASWFGQQITFTFDSVPSDVTQGSYFGVSGASPAGYNSTLEAPWLVLSILGNDVSVLALTNPGAYVTGGTVATSLLPNPLTTDGNGHYFFYTSPGLVSVQWYGPSIFEQDFPDQGIGTVAGGSVTSVAMTVPAELDITGSPITSSGTLALSWANQDANLVFAGPTSGGAGTPSFRALVAADIPGLGGVTSVGLTLAVPGIFTESVSGSPVTTAGTLAGTIGLQTQLANTFWGGPSSGSAAQPTFRAMVANDLPNGLGELFTVSLKLTAAQLKAMPATAVQLLAAPGANKFYYVTSLSGVYKFVTTAYTIAHDDNALFLGYSGAAADFGSLLCTGFVDQTASTMEQGAANAEALNPLADITNLALLVNLEGTSPLLTLGDGTVQIDVVYYVVTVQ
jgi:hypothetical protein